MSDNPLTLSLDAILAVTRTRVRALKRRAGDLERQAAAAPPVRPFMEPADTVGLIAEVKRRSPSQGDIRPDLDPVQHARAYVRGGAVAVSVLTDEAHFGGSIEDLERVAAAVPVPVLRKDFILDELQIMEARAAGASAVLLIGAAAAWRLPTLIEVHSAAELEPALAAAPGAIGVNARDLSTFAVDLRAAEAVIRDVPGNIAVVAESGVESRNDIERVAAAGADFVLVGTSVARHGDPEEAVRALVGVKRKSGVRP